MIFNIDHSALYEYQSDIIDLNESYCRYKQCEFDNSNGYKSDMSLNESFGDFANKIKSTIDKLIQIVKSFFSQIMNQFKLYILNVDKLKSKYAKVENMTIMSDTVLFAINTYSNLYNQYTYMSDDSIFGKPEFILDGLVKFVNDQTNDEIDGAYLKDGFDSKDKLRMLEICKSYLNGLDVTFTDLHNTKYTKTHDPRYVNNTSINCLGVVKAIDITGVRLKQAYTFICNFDSLNKKLNDTKTELIKVLDETKTKIVGTNDGDMLDKQLKNLNLIYSTMMSAMTEIMKTYTTAVVSASQILDLAMTKNIF
jgi:hypothetical protein